MKMLVEIFSFIYTKIFTLEILLHKNYSYEKKWIYGSDKQLDFQDWWENIWGIDIGELRT